MAKESYWFKHDHNARGDEKILELRSEFGAEGYGVFWMIVETMAENSNGGVKASLIGGLSLGYGVTKEMLSEFINYCVEIELFYEEDGFLFSRRMKKHKEFRQTQSDYGKTGALKRWGGYSPPNAKERKGKEIKGKEINGHHPELTEKIISSNFNRQPTIPTKKQVWEVFSLHNGTKEMAKSFYEKHEGTGWFLGNSPITNFTPLAIKFIDSWKRNEEKDKPVDSSKVKIVLK